MHRLIRPITFLTLVLALGACGGDDTPTSPTPPPTTPTTVTETFSGTLNPNGAATHTFSSQASGTVTVTLTALAPDNTLVVGMSLGTFNNSSCQIVIAKDNATQGTIVVGGVSSFANLCVRAYDVGNITGPTTYEISVVHP